MMLMLLVHKPLNGTVLGSFFFFKFNYNKKETALHMIALKINIYIGS